MLVTGSHLVQARKITDITPTSRLEDTTEMCCSCELAMYNSLITQYMHGVRLSLAVEEGKGHCCNIQVVLVNQCHS